MEQKGSYFVRFLVRHVVELVRVVVQIEQLPLVTIIIGRQCFVPVEWLPGNRSVQHILQTK